MTRTRFEWNERKRNGNLEKHGFDFIDAEETFNKDTVTLIDDLGVYGERRFLTIGQCKNAVVVISHTEEDNTIRIISMRKATRHEEDSYFKEVGHELETDQSDEG